MSERPLVATYRLQLRQGFGFDQATALLDYLSELGISHVCLSPCMQATPGSTHGYDVTDPNRVDDSLGGEPARQRFLDALAEHGLSHVVDIVPNHMSVASEQNQWWWDVLENGPDSAHAASFDVDWAGPTAAARNTVLLPILTQRYGRAVEEGSIFVQRDGANFTLCAQGRRLPLAPESLGQLFSETATACDSIDLEVLAEVLSGCAGSALDVSHRRRRTALVRRQLVELLESRPELASAIDRSVARVNSDPSSLDALIGRQHYRLAHYRVARHDLDYRRFFDVNELIALSTDKPAVFEETHRRVLTWIRAGEVSAVRVDHPDGLRDPIQYFERLQAISPSLWILAEKILQPGEQLPRDFRVAGTTGYDFCAAVGGLFVDPSAEPGFSELCKSFIGSREVEDFAATARAAKRFVLDDSLASDLRRLTLLLEAIARPRLRYRDFTYEELRQGLREVLACSSVYRTYARPGVPLSFQDQHATQQAIQLASQQRPDLDLELLGLLEQLLRGACEAPLEWDFVARFQQLSATTMAKGVEDTAFYRYPRLLSLNEVGCDPGKFGSSPAEFHEFCSKLQEHWPNSLVATTTHDTKRSEDARLRISALSELEARFRSSVSAWSERARGSFQGDPPDRALEYWLWQTLVAAHPIDEARLTTHLTKAMREAKLASSWLDPNASYEASVLGFAGHVLRDAALMRSVAELVDEVLPIALRSSLSQTLLKLTACGVPDIYQGAELSDTRLTDPDNRTPVDFELCRKSLALASRSSAEEAMAAGASGLAKIWLIQRVLGLRRMKPAWFDERAAHVPLAAEGSQASRVVTFARGERVVVVAPRLWGGLLRLGFGDTRLRLGPGTFRNLFDSDPRYSGSVALEELLRRFPVALLIAEGAD
jgi:(1->4)-alpha-D-glucan 1-alpha-D-glucosylmutase